ncbi:unnamed protein product, partial [Mesorhabditis belari]|uniref:Geminin n=1 Tax=Mesorhabditis belari TaxID=2138241 RepID=A0AAF3FFQ1_9BILA
MSSTLRIGLKDVANQSLNSDRKTSLNKTPSIFLSKELKAAINVTKGTETKQFNSKTYESSCQTEISSLVDLGPVTSADLTEDEPSDAYWKAHCDSLEEQLDKELDLSLTLSGQLFDKTSELMELEENLNLLEEALEEASASESL